jgi:hypothetical protein
MKKDFVCQENFEKMRICWGMQRQERLRSPKDPQMHRCAVKRYYDAASFMLPVCLRRRWNEWDSSSEKGICPGSFFALAR